MLKNTTDEMVVTGNKCQYLGIIIVRSNAWLYREHVKLFSGLICKFEPHLLGLFPIFEAVTPV